MTKSSVRLRGSGQADSFATLPGESMKYVLLLNGVLPLASPISADPDWLSTQLRTVAPDALPGLTGPISLVLIL